MRCRFALLASLVATVALSEEATEEAKEVDEEKEVAAKDDITQPYTQPSTEGLHWVETFDGDALSRWTPASNEKYNGKFKVDKRRKEALIGDMALLVPDEAKHYGISRSFPALTGATEVPFVLQFEVRFQDGLQCGGSYVKVFDSNGQKAEDFGESTPYLIMFGPDRCGGTDKVHFILRHKNPKTGEWEEKHLKDAPRVPGDHLTHLYGLIINPDNTFEVQVDGEKKASGDLLTAMSPAINPPKEIDDSSDKKPSDWVEEATMPDPESSKPDDWDEAEPFSIPDPAATIPDGWREDVTAGKIPDPSAKTPADWDDEEDGEWEAPIIDNPDCKVGCGKWSPPTINNPKYKGKWSAPKIDNPDYKGVWKPKQIANPDYFEDNSPAILPKIDSIGIDIWTMQGGILFDNFLLATDPTRAAAFAEETWKIRKNIEELQMPPPAARGGSWLDMLNTYMIPIGVAATTLFIAMLWFCFCRRSAVPPPPVRQQPAQKKKRDETPLSPAPAQEKDPAEEGEDKDAAEPKDDEDKKDD